jgi:hypothetical protein
LFDGDVAHLSGLLWHIAKAGKEASASSARIKVLPPNFLARSLPALISS